MKKQLRKITALLMLCLLLMSTLLLPASAAGTGEFDPPGNLVQNPGFEADRVSSPNMPAAWSAEPGTIGVPTPFGGLFPIHSGKTSYVFVNNISSTEGIAGAYQEIEIPEDGQYEFSTYMHAATDKLTLLAGKESRVFDGFAGDAEQGPESYWKKCTLEFYATKGSKVTVTLRSNIGKSIYIDDVCLIRVGNSAGLLNNGNFENDLTGWTQVGESFAYASSTEMKSGRRSLFMPYFKAEPQRNYLEQAYTSIQIGAAYSFSAFIKTAAGFTGQGAMLFLEARDSYGTLIALSASPAVINSGGGWVQTEAQLTLPPTTKTLTAKIAGMNCVGGFYVDDAFLTLK